MAYLKCKAVSHARQVCSAYKRLLRAVSLEDLGATVVIDTLDVKKKYPAENYYYWDDDDEDDADLYLGYPYARELIRHEFEKNRHMTDMVKARDLLIDIDRLIWEELGGQEDENDFIDDPHGLEYQRHEVAPDWIFDTWHPLERLQYPKFFGLRNLRKVEHLEKWNAKYGKPKGAPDFSHLKEQFVKHVHALESKTDKTEESKKSS